MTWLIDWLRLKLRAAEIVFQESAPEHSQQTHNGTRIQQKAKENHKWICQAPRWPISCAECQWLNLRWHLHEHPYKLTQKNTTQHNTSNTFTFTHLVLYFVSPFPKERNISVPNWSRLFYVSEIIWGIRFFFLITLQGCDAVNCPLLPALGVFYCWIVMRTWVSGCFSPFGLNELNSNTIELFSFRIILSLYYHTTIYKHCIYRSSYQLQQTNTVCLNSLNHFSKSLLCRLWLVCLSCDLRRLIVCELVSSPSSTDFPQLKSSIHPRVNKHFGEQINRQRRRLLM